MHVIWSAEYGCGYRGGSIGLKWVLISIFKVMVAAPHRGFVPLELCSLSSFISPRAFNFLLSHQKRHFLGPLLVLAEGAGGGM